MSRLSGVFNNIDSNYDKHIETIRSFIRQKSISQTGEGVIECAQMHARFLRELGCGDVLLVDDGFRSPVVYGKYDAGAEKTLIIYMMYDVQPADEPNWSVPPFEARILEPYDPYKKAIVARGAINSKGPQVAFLNTLASIKEVEGELPVNLIFVIEGEEELGSPSLPKFVHKYKDELAQADATFMPLGGQDEKGVFWASFGSEGLVYIELETSGAQWGRGPTEFGIHGSLKLIVDSPGWRHVKMLSTIVSEDGNRVSVEGWYDDLQPPSEEEEKLLDEAAKYYDFEGLKRRLKIPRFIGDAEGIQVLRMMHYGSSFSLDGIWGGYTGPGTKTLVAHKVTSKHNIRFHPNQRAEDLVEKLRRHLQRHGYTDVDLKVLASYPWARASYNTDIAKALLSTCEKFGVKALVIPPILPMEAMPAAPFYLFIEDPLRLPFARGCIGNHGARAHSPDEYFVLEGNSKVLGLRESEKGYAYLLYRYAGKDS